MILIILGRIKILSSFKLDPFGKEGREQVLFLDKVLTTNFALSKVKAKLHL